MRRTSVLVTLATAAVAVGLAVPALATPQPPTPASLADLGGSGQPVIDWNRRLIAILRGRRRDGAAGRRAARR